MRFFIYFLASALLTAGALSAKGKKKLSSSPMNMEIGEEKIAEVICEWNNKGKKASGKLKGIEGTEGDMKLIEGHFRYRVWLPKGYHDKANSNRKYPFLVIDHSGGKSHRKFSIFKDWIQKNEWICIMMIDSRNSSWEAAVGNYLSMMKDLPKRLRIADKGGVFCGSSGGGRRATWFSSYFPEYVGGVLHSAGISCFRDGNRVPFGRYKHIYSASILADRDFNIGEMTYAMKAMGKRGYYKIYSGKHSWFPPSEAAAGMTWLSMKMHLRGKSKLHWKSAAAFGSYLLEGAENSKFEMQKYMCYEQLNELFKGRADVISDKGLLVAKKSLYAKMSAMKRNPDFQREAIAMKKYKKVYKKFCIDDFFKSLSWWNGSIYLSDIDKVIKTTKASRDGAYKEMLKFQKLPEGSYVAELAKKEIARLDTYKEKIKKEGGLKGKKP